MDGREHKDFIRDIVTRDVEAGKHDGRVATRFPPEPNGYLHIGHAKSIVLNFGVAREFGGTCNLRFDDTNPATEDPEFVESIQDSVRWLGYEWDELLFASDYFERFYELAEGLIRQGLAYVDDSTEEEIRELRGTVTEPGRPSSYRDRTPEENLDLFRRMRAGEFPDGAKVLRAKIDLASPNMKMRDPLLYRIRHETHYRAGDTWCIYPMYDYAHCLEDAFEGITHSLCTLEFDNNREIYDWVIEHADVPHTPRQIEFARLNLSYTVMSKRKLGRLVRKGRVDGWDDPRMPTLAGYARRGYTPEAIRAFCESIGVAKSNSLVDVAQLEHAIRDDLNTRAPRVLCVLRPLKVVIENYPEDGEETLEAPFWPRDVPREGSRELPFSRELWIERDDFMEDPPKRFHRLAPGREVRLRYGYFIRCERVVKDDDGRVTELRCTYDPETRGGSSPDGRSPKGTIHWVSARHAVPVEARLYDRLFRVEQPDQEEGDLTDHLNPDSVEVIHPAYLEPAVADADPGDRFQFERQGYFYLDPENTAAAGRPVYHRVVSLKDSWARKGGPAEPRKATPEPPAERTAPASPPDPDAGRRTLVEDERFQRLHRELGVPEALADALARREALTDVFDRALATYGAGAETLAHWVGNELARVAKERPLEDVPVSPADLGELARMVDRGTLSASAAKTVFEEMVAGGGPPREIVDHLGLTRLDDETALGAAVDRVLDAHPDETAQYREGKKALFGFFMGRLMAETGGRANPRLAQDLLRRRLDD